MSREDGRSPKRRRFDTPCFVEHHPSVSFYTPQPICNGQPYITSTDLAVRSKIQFTGTESQFSGTVGLNENPCNDFTTSSITAALSPTYHNSSYPKAFQPSLVVSTRDNGFRVSEVRVTNSRLDVDPTTQVCYGMVSNIHASLPSNAAHLRFASSLNARLVSSTAFIVGERLEAQGTINNQFSPLIQALLEEEAMSVQVRCTPQGRVSGIPSNRPEMQLSTPCVISIVLYGPNELYEDIGIFFQEYDVCLEDPNNCDRNVLYRNPHRLSSTDIANCPHTWELDKKAAIVELRDLPAPKDLLEEYNNNEDLAEAEQPCGLKTQLGRHQKQGLTFMQRRECGWTFNPNSSEMWEEYCNSRGRFFINKITDSYQREEPPQCYGGILADPMGLGKTLTIISLVLGSRHLEWNTNRPKPTLIIVPPSLLSTWEEQLSEHVLQGSLTWCRHHSRSRLATISEASSYDIVLTTYHTVSADWKKDIGAERSLLFTISWQRIVLDEAHWIRNESSQMAKAVFSLDAFSRWAVTGTPLQNSLSDLATLFKFLRVAPYCHTKTFEADITQFWKNGNVEEATKRLRRLLCCLLLRRAKNTIQLPQRHDTICPIHFDEEERLIYEDAKGEALHMVNEALFAGTQTSKGYLNALQRINKLRMLCNLGKYYRSQTNISRSASPSQEWLTLVQQAFISLSEFGDLACHHCSMSIEASESSGKVDHLQHLSSCLRLICSKCQGKINRKDDGSTLCGHDPACPTAPVTSTGSSGDDVSRFDALNASPTMLPTKIATVVSHLKALESTVKSVVFSYWTSTLDLVQRGLDTEKIKCVRFDGLASLKKRQKAVDVFRTDPSTRVMLLTLSCGAVGLNLTVASRAYLIEPHWNPTLEEQALARIHRIGQTQEVTTVRFYMKDSFEEHVIKIQQSKKDLADLLLVPNNESQRELNIRRLEHLRSLL